MAENSGKSNERLVALGHAANKPSDEPPADEVRKVLHLFRGLEEVARARLCGLSAAQRARFIRAWCEPSENNQGSSRYDPLLDDPALKARIDEAGRRAAAELEPEYRGRDATGMSHLIWYRQQEILAEQDIDWMRPSQMNPHMMYD